MRITGDNLKAIEKAIGYNAEASIIAHDGHFRGTYPGTTLEVSATVDGRKCHTWIDIHGDIPAIHVCHRVVDQMNAYIRDLAFGK